MSFNSTDGYASRATIPAMAIGLSFFPELVRLWPSVALSWTAYALEETSTLLGLHQARVDRRVSDHEEDVPFENDLI